MNDSQVDQLFQVLTNRPGAGIGPLARSRDDGLGFEKHLRQASSSASSYGIDATPVPLPPRGQSNDRWLENHRPTAPPSSDSGQASSAFDDRDVAPSVREDEPTDDLSKDVSPSAVAANIPLTSSAPEKNSRASSVEVDSPGPHGATESNGKLNAAHGTRSKNRATANTKADNSKTAADGATDVHSKQSAAASEGESTDKKTETDELSLSTVDAKDDKKEVAGEVVAGVERQGVVAAVVPDQEGGQQTQSTEGAATSRGRTKAIKSDVSKTHGSDSLKEIGNQATERAEQGKKSSTAESPTTAAVSNAPEPATAKPARKQSAPSDKPDVTDEETSADRPRATSDNRTAVATSQEVIAAAIVKDSAPAATVDAAEANAGPKKVGEVKPNLLTSVGRLDRNATTGARNSQGSSENQSAPAVDPARFVTRVAKAISTAHERGGPLQLRLSPPELGAMRLELAVKDGALTASIETDNSHARQTLLDNLPALRDRLGEQNIRIERFDVDVRQDGSEQGNPGTQQRQHQQQSPQTQHRSDGPRRTTIDAPLSGSQPAINTITSATINLIA